MLVIENSLALAIDFQERLMNLIHHSEGLIRKSAIFIEGCRILGVPVLVTQQYTKGLGGTVPPIKAALMEYEPIEKITFSCFRDEGFMGRLEQAGKRDVVVTGIEAHI